MTSPFLSALSSIGSPGGALQSFVGNPIRAYQEQDTINQFEDQVKALQAQGINGPQALVQTMTQNPKYFHELPQDYLSNQDNLLKLIIPKPEGAKVISQPNGMLTSSTPDPSAPGGFKLTDLGVHQGPQGPTDAMRKVTELMDFNKTHGLPAPDAETITRILGGGAPGGTSVTVNGPQIPDMIGPLNSIIHAFTDPKAQGSERENMVSQLDNAEKGVAELNKLAGTKGADQFFGLKTYGSEYTGPIAAALGYDTSLGPFGGANIDALASAKAKAQYALKSAALLIQSQRLAGRVQMLASDQEKVDQMAADPSSVWTSPQAIKGATDFLLAQIKQLRTHYSTELYQGGTTITPAPGTPQAQPQPGKTKVRVPGPSTPLPNPEGDATGFAPPPVRGNPSATMPQPAQSSAPAQLPIPGPTDLQYLRANKNNPLIRQRFDRQFGAGMADKFAGKATP